MENNLHEAFLCLKEIKMRIIPSLEALNSLKNIPLVDFIKESSPWLQTEDWDAESMGYTFILSEQDSILMRTLCIVPHAPFDDQEYRQQMTIDLSTYNEWEHATYDSKTKYYQAVTVVGSVYGANIFMSESFVKSIPNLKQTLEQLIEKEKSDVEQTK